MPLRFYNTLTQEKEIFKPIQAGQVGIYLCGPTVYRESHIGHAVGPVVFDALKRYLSFKGFKVRWVVNITDVEDKLIEEAQQQNCRVSELAERVARSYRDALAQLGVHGIDHMPKASEHITEIIAMIERLITNGYAYTSGGDVYFEVSRDDDYGKLSNRRTEDQAGQRELSSADKRSPHDFALWKASKPEEPEEVCYASPWGCGRPGWHIECSAMSMKLLGETFDIHGGGMDLIFPHHENEIAQSESCTGKPFVKYWLHNGLTRFNTKKISKSDPTMQIMLSRMTLSHLLNQYSGELLRYFILSTHYRRPIEFSDEELASRQKGLDSFYRLFERINRSVNNSPYDDHPTLHRPKFEAINEQYHEFVREMLEMRNEYLDALDDDFNTAAAISVLFKEAAAINRLMDRCQVETSTDQEARQLVLGACRSLVEDGRIIGLFLKTPAQLVKLDESLTDRLVEMLIQLRSDAKKDKHFALADRIRDELAALGVVLEDSRDGTRWRKS
ncbi:MAG: Cysteine--tRNA ligase [Phycisphaerae bacterium]|nr:Cysteine--tRNA ligase [Phycisphaerae bacterium]